MNRISFKNSLCIRKICQDSPAKSLLFFPTPDSDISSFTFSPYSSLGFISCLSYALISSSSPHSTVMISFPQTFSNPIHQLPPSLLLLNASKTPMCGQSVIIFPNYKISLYSDFHYHWHVEHATPWPETQWNKEGRGILAPGLHQSCTWTLHPPPSQASHFTICGEDLFWMFNRWTDGYFWLYVYIYTHIYTHICVHVVCVTFIYIIYILTQTSIHIYTFILYTCVHTHIYINVNTYVCI